MLFASRVRGTGRSQEMAHFHPQSLKMKYLRMKSDRDCDTKTQAVLYRPDYCSYEQAEEELMRNMFSHRVPGRKEQAARRGHESPVSEACYATSFC